jgi:ribosomal protein L29
VNEFRSKQVKDGWAVIDDLGEACATYETLREAKREAMRLQGIWDRAQCEHVTEIEELRKQLADAKAAYADLRSEVRFLLNKASIGVGA